MDTYEARLATFSAPQASGSGPSRRGKGAAAAAAATPAHAGWPHASRKGGPSAAQLAQQGFRFAPSAAAPDRCEHALCSVALDTWRAADDPLARLAAVAPECPLGLVLRSARERDAAVVAAEDLAPRHERMTQARIMTFGQAWPYDGKKGWRPTSARLAEAGFHYAPSEEEADNATCAYCERSLGGWEKNDDPIEEHRRREPDCYFFTSALPEKVEEQEALKPAKATKKGRSVSRRVAAQEAEEARASEAEASAAETAPEQETEPETEPETAEGAAAGRSTRRTKRAALTPSTTSESVRPTRTGTRAASRAASTSKRTVRGRKATSEDEAEQEEEPSVAVPEAAAAEAQESAAEEEAAQPPSPPITRKASTARGKGRGRAVSARTRRNDAPADEAPDAQAAPDATMIQHDVDDQQQAAPDAAAAVPASSDRADGDATARAPVADEADDAPMDVDASEAVPAPPSSVVPSGSRGTRSASTRSVSGRKGATVRSASASSRRREAGDDETDAPAPVAAVEDDAVMAQAPAAALASSSAQPSSEELEVPKRRGRAPSAKSAGTDAAAKDVTASANGLSDAEPAKGESQAQVALPAHSREASSGVVARAPPSDPVEQPGSDAASLPPSSDAPAAASGGSAPFGSSSPVRATAPLPRSALAPLANLDGLLDDAARAGSVEAWLRAQVDAACRELEEAGERRLGELRAAMQLGREQVERTLRGQGPRGSVPQAAQ